MATRRPRIYKRRFDRVFYHGAVVVMPEVQRKHQRRCNCFPNSDSTAHSRNSIIYISLKSPSLGDLNAACSLFVSRSTAEPGGDVGPAGDPGAEHCCPVQPPQRQQIESRSIAGRWNRLSDAIQLLVRLIILRVARQVVGVGSWAHNLIWTGMASSTTKIYTATSRRPFYTITS